MAQTIKEKIRRISTWEGGQRLFNFAYSIGAAIVIWGALFKILHLSGGDLLLCIGMGTEVLMFILTAFDRPPKEYHWEEVFPSLGKDGKKEQTGEDRLVEEVQAQADEAEQEAPDAPQEAYQPVQGVPTVQGVPVQGVIAVQGGQPIQGGQPVQIVAGAPVVVAPAEPLPVNAAEVEAISKQVEMLGEMSQQTAEYMAKISDLSHNIDGLNTIYEIQLKSISSQLDSIERVNRGIKDMRDMIEKSANQSAAYCMEIEKMQRLMQQLNQVYEKMLTNVNSALFSPENQQ